MAPIHEWKDDAEFIRYNQPERPKWWEPIVEFIVGCAALAFCALIVVAGFGAAISDSERTCYRGTAQSVDCDLFSPCRQVNGHDRIIDVELNYAKHHPECRTDWTPAKLREAQVYWATDGRDQ